MKKCFKCQQEKPLGEFYKNPNMADGRVNKCKPCTRAAVLENRNKRIDYYRAYDRKRGNRQSLQYVREYRRKYPNKYRATNMVNNAIRDGKIKKGPCETCGEPKNVHAHHDDYLKPLDVRWLCAAHHHQWHAENGEAKNP